MSETSSDWQRTTIDSAQAAAHPETAQAVARIKALRQTIDNIDSAVIALLAERFKATSQVGVLKANAGFAPEDTKREDYRSNASTASPSMPGLIRKLPKCTVNSWLPKPRSATSA